MKRMFYVIREKIPLEKEQPAHITISAAMCMTAFVLIIGAGMFYGRIRNGYSGNKNNSVDTVFNDYDGMYGSTAAGSADEAGVSIEVKDEKMTNRSRKIKFFLDKMKAQENQTESKVKNQDSNQKMESGLSVKSSVPLSHSSFGRWVSL